MAPPLSCTEIGGQPALLRRLKQLLEKKKAKCREYLVALEAQERSIAAGDIDRLEQQGMAAESIVFAIYAIQKALAPIEAMCRESAAAIADGSVLKLQADMERLHADIQRQCGKNRELLKSKMEQAQKEIAALKKPHARKSVYARESEIASAIDIKA